MGLYAVNVITPVVKFALDDFEPTSMNRQLKVTSDKKAHRPINVSILKEITKEDVLEAIASLDNGQKHSFGEAKRYYLIHNGKRYAPKAIVGLAATRLLGRPLEHYEFKSGEVQVNRLLRKLEFEVVNKESLEGRLNELTNWNISYSIDEAMKGLFISKEYFEEIVQSLNRKKNIILQGPPGVGKSFIAKRIAFALIQSAEPNNVQMVQFHQSYSYEDFMQGWRPDEKGGFSLKNGIFHRFCERAQNDPESKYVFIIDEINRGNLSKILGELMLLIECDKRGVGYAIPLTYSNNNDPLFYVPENIHLIGLMNTADRSLAMVDYALRRRFVFFDIEPNFDSDGFQSFLEEAGVTKNVVNRVVTRMTELNKLISEDSKNLGHGFAIGHSFFCPLIGQVIQADDWYRAIIKTEIAPLLREYYFDDPEKVEDLISTLLG